MSGLVALYALISTFFIPSSVLQDRANHPLIKKDTNQVIDFKEKSKITIEIHK